MTSPRRPDASHKKDFIRLLHENADRHRLYEVFAHFCELSALSLRNAVDVNGRAEREQRFHKIRERYSDAQMTRFSHMLSNLVMLMEDGFADTLGNLFMSLEFGNQYAGQFFTPYELQRLMAELTMSDVTAERITERGGFIQMNEPACGAGGMVLACADVLRARGLNPQKCLHVTAVDIAEICVHMTYIHLSLHHIPAVVVHGNTLSLKEYDQWCTPAHILGGWRYRLAARKDARYEEQPLVTPLAEDDAEPSGAIAAAEEAATPSSTPFRPQMSLF